MGFKEKLDINEDGKVNWEDFVALIESQVDLDGDGKIELVEVVTVVKSIVEVF